MRARLRSWWQIIKQHWVAILAVAFILVVAVGLLLVVARFYGTGFNGYNQVTTARTISGPSAGTVVRTEVSQPGKTLWDWLQLLIIPFALAIIALVFQLVNTRTERQIAKERYLQDQQIALDKQQGDILQAYLDRMSELLLGKKLLSLEDNAEVRNVARVRTITILTQLNARRIGYVFTFLQEAGLMSPTSNDNAVSLRDADLRAVTWSQVNLSDANLSGAKLSGADLMSAILRKAKLSDANLSDAKLSGADLSDANLSDADLSRADLFLANLSRADLLGAFLRGANLDSADLSGAKLNGVDLRHADLSGADLSQANLKGAVGITTGGLEKQAKSLKGATMPDGSIHP